MAVPPEAVQVDIVRQEMTVSTAIGGVEVRTVEEVVVEVVITTDEMISKVPTIDMAAMITTDTVETDSEEIEEVPEAPDTMIEEDLEGEVSVVVAVAEAFEIDPMMLVQSLASTASLLLAFARFPLVDLREALHPPPVITINVVFSYVKLNVFSLCIAFYLS
ncbi:hypothetical protein Ciccas_009522 [Cichlidogyrus casuarinus]|uniref:Uncharacterized protein n=1 Tax=Cichlidogyrus casuarinus TaxID=1844966 RepID=A0ABD2PWT6_9PLAT